MGELEIDDQKAGQAVTPEKTPYDLLMEYERSKRPRRSTKELKRSWIRPKKREKKTLWRTQQVKLDSKGMATLRSKRYEMSEGICECSKIPKKFKRCCDKKGCGLPVTYRDGQLHHMHPRAHGGSDTIKNTRFIRRDCHDIITGKPQWSRPILPEYMDKKPPQNVGAIAQKEQVGL